jgi:DNA polymerase-3 subunit alpha
MANEEIATRTGGILAGIEMKRRKKDDRAWAVVSLEGLDGAMECLVFPDCYDKHADVLVPEAPVFVEGRLSMRDEENPSFVAENILPLESAPQTLTREVHIRVYEASVNQEKLAALKELCARHAGEAELILCIVSHDGDIAFAKCAGGICNSVAFRQEVFDLLGENALVQKAKPCQIEAPRQRRWQGPPVPAAAG